MSKNAVASKQTPPRPYNIRPILYLLGEVERARAEKESAEGRLTRFASELRVLLNTLPPNEREVYSQRLDEISGTPKTTTHHDSLQKNIIQLFRQAKNRELSVPEVQAQLTQGGREAELKTVHNTISYLTKIGHLVRVSRGRYLLKELGVGVEYEGRDDGTSRATEHDI